MAQYQGGLLIGFSVDKPEKAAKTVDSTYARATNGAACRCRKADTNVLIES